MSLAITDQPISMDVDQNSKNDHRTTPFGREMRERHFLFEQGFINLNHGSFGTYPRQIRDRLREFQDMAEAAPDRFIRYEYPRLLDEARIEMANFLRVPVEEVVFVANATTAVNVVLRNLSFQEGDLILYMDSIYGACEKTIKYITEMTPAKSVKLEFTCPISNDELLRRFRNTLFAHRGRMKLAIFDTISSLPGVRIPFERLNEIAREEGVLTLIDGAHGVGHLPLNLTSLQPDFFVSNCHKWLFTPRGCAVFYVPIRNQAILRSSLPTSHYFDPLRLPGSKAINNPLPPSTMTISAKGPTGKTETKIRMKSNFEAQFEFVGSVDGSPYLCIPEALRFRYTICGGEARIMAYCTELARVGGNRIVEILGTEIMDTEAGELSRDCCMINVRLPLDVIDIRKDFDHKVDGGANGYNSNSDKIPLENAPAVTVYLTARMTERYSTFMAILFYHGVWWARLSAQVYLELEDFEHGGYILKTLCQEVKEGRYLVS